MKAVISGIVFCVCAVFGAGYVAHAGWLDEAFKEGLKQQFKEEAQKYGKQKAGEMLQGNDAAQAGVEAGANTQQNFDGRYGEGASRQLFEGAPRK